MTSFVTMHLLLALLELQTTIIIVSRLLQVRILFVSLFIFENIYEI